MTSFHSTPPYFAKMFSSKAVYRGCQKKFVPSSYPSQALEESSLVRTLEWPKGRKAFSPMTFFLAPKLLVFPQCSVCEVWCGGIEVRILDMLLYHLLQLVLCSSVPNEGNACEVFSGKKQTFLDHCPESVTKPKLRYSNSWNQSQNRKKI